MRKKIIGYVTLFALLLSLLPAGALAADVDAPQAGEQACNCDILYTAGNIKSRAALYEAALLD